MTLLAGKTRARHRRLARPRARAGRRRSPREGARVAFTLRARRRGRERRSPSRGARRAARFRVSVLDVPGTEAMVARARARRGAAIDVLVNNAGISQNLPLALMEEEDWDRVMDVNVKGTFLTSRAVLRGMIRRKRGVVLNIGSLAGVRMMEAPVHYCASKAAIKGLTRGAGQGGRALRHPRALPRAGPARGRRRPQPSRVPPRRLPEALLARPRRHARRGRPARRVPRLRRQQLHDRARRSSIDGGV